MCDWFKKKPATEFPVCPPQKTIEELIREKAQGMTDQQMAQYWYELDQLCFRELGECAVETWEITAGEFENTIKRDYPTLEGLKVSDSVYTVTDLKGLQKILTRDWVNLVPYVANVFDCDAYGLVLAGHFQKYYEIKSVIPVWGDTSAGYHGFNLAVVKGIDGLIARLIEPQQDSIMVDVGMLGTYIPRSAVVNYGKLA